jgi:hypothetical protein
MKMANLEDGSEIGAGILHPDAPKQYKTPALQSLHEAMSDLYDIGAIDGDKMREFDKTCLVSDDKS